jgi:phytoene dehydrogenase-like protein
VGWPLPRGGSQRLADGLASCLRSLGGVIETGRRVESFDQLKGAGAVLFDTTPRQLVSMAGDHLPHRYRRRLAKFRYGPGVFKLDLALDGPVPWKAEECSRAGTVHVGGTLAEIAESELAPHRNMHAEKPFVLVAQQSLFDSSRAPAGKQALWAYCHVPNGSTVDMSDRILNQIERFAPGFRDRILAKSTMSCSDFEEYNANYIGGDISAGAHTGLQLLARPLMRLNPYSTPNPRIFICSASTPPGAGVHGMCGYFAARAAVRRTKGMGERVLSEARSPS